MLTRSKKCLARILSHAKKKFCGKPARFNDLCRWHDRKMARQFYVPSWEDSRYEYR